jgi:FMN phosphatase YigB (HAD superfamily)
VSGIAAVTFDISSTLMFDTARPETRVRRRAVRKWLLERGVEHEDYRRVVTAAVAAWVGRSEDPTEHVAGELGLSLSRTERAELAPMVEALCRTPRYVATDGAADALELLAARGVALGIVSNRGTALPGALVARDMAREGLADFFPAEAVVWSDEAGARKPEPEIFVRALRALGVPPWQAAHVGNRKAQDVAGARWLGMVTIRYTGRKDDTEAGPEADVVIDDFAELGAAVRGGTAAA